MAAISRLVLDVLKPVEVPTASVARDVRDLDGVDATAARLVETDRTVQNIVLVVEGSAVDDERVIDRVEDLGGTLHSVDEVVCGDRPPMPPEVNRDATWLR